jgi:hypothetical protein
MKRSTVAGFLAGATLLACAGSAQAAQPFVPIHKDTIKVPKGVQPWLPTWTPDGRDIVFQNQLDGTTWITGATGKGTHCVSCEFGDRPRHIVGGFTYAFPDKKRLFVSKELGNSGGSDDPADADAYILECTPSVVKCTSHRYLPVDMSADKGPQFIVQRRTWHLAPDGVHLGWMDLRIDGTVMIVATLQRQADKYVAADPRVVNPQGPSSLTDTDPTHWENQSQLNELKSFADGGRSVLVLSEAFGNIDPYKVDLRTGKTTRLIGNLDWDEDGAISPDGDLDVIYSWRTRHRMDALAWIPQVRAFAGLEWAAALAPHYVSTWEGFQCDLSPWLLPGGGDEDGKLTGQPLDVYSGNYTPGNNLSGNQFWSPDSTRVLLQERLRTRPPADVNEQVAQKGLAPNRIAIARIDREPAKAEKVVSSTVGSWAPPAATFPGTLSSNRIATVNGAKGGTATIEYRGSIAAGSITTTYKDYTDDGKTFVNGTLSGSTEDATAKPWMLKADVTVSGEHTGRLQVNLAVDNAHKPLPAKSGTFSAVYDGGRAPALPKLGPCYSKLPAKTPLDVAAKRSGSRVQVVVSAEIEGDERPVAGAEVKSGGKTVRTDARGRATVAPGKIAVTAGDTFKKRTVRR